MVDLNLRSAPPMRRSRRVPDFIIAGAMKCGTTSLHRILAAHPRIFIPSREIHYFDIDDITQHPDFFFHDGERWHRPDLRNREHDYRDWYAGFFEAARPDQVIGEDSTTYLASTLAPQRIANAGKMIRIIVMLRDPADRAWSHYWHLVRTGRATHSFEQTLQRDPCSVLLRSQYKSQIENFLRYLSRERLHFIVFEDFVGDIAAWTRNACAFLGVDPDLIIDSETHAHANEGSFPRHPGLHLWRNRLLRDRAMARYREHLIDVPARHASHLARVIENAHSFLNPLKTRDRPRMRAETRRMLDDYFFTQNAGLSDLIGIDVERRWYHSAEFPQATTPRTGCSAVRV